MSTPVKPRLRLINYHEYTDIWRDWCRNHKQYVRWGQYLCDKYNLTEEAAPGLFDAKTVKEANEIFWKYHIAD